MNTVNTYVDMFVHAPALIMTRLGGDGTTPVIEIGQTKIFALADDAQDQVDFLRDLATKAAALADQVSALHGLEDTGEPVPFVPTEVSA